jgi:predicted transcriptional regulator
VETAALAAVVLSDWEVRYVKTKCKVDGFKIKLLLSRMCISEREFCSKSGVAHATLRSAINGCDVTIKTVGKLAKGLEVEPNEIMLSEG